MPDKNEPDLQPFDDAGNCKHIHTRKLTDSELRFCVKCDRLPTAPMEIEAGEDGRGEAI